MIDDPTRTLILYECACRRRLLETCGNVAPCSFCGRAFSLLSTFTRESGENVVQFRMRAMRWRGKR